MLVSLRAWLSLTEARESLPKRLVGKAWSGAHVGFELKGERDIYRRASGARRH